MRRAFSAVAVSVAWVLVALWYLLVALIAVSGPVALIGTAGLRANGIAYAAFWDALPWYWLALALWVSASLLIYGLAMRNVREREGRADR